MNEERAFITATTPSVHCMYGIYENETHLCARWSCAICFFCFIKINKKKDPSYHSSSESSYDSSFFRHSHSNVSLLFLHMLGGGKPIQKRRVWLLLFCITCHLFPLQEQHKSIFIVLLISASQLVPQQASGTTSRRGKR